MDAELLSALTGLADARKSSDLARLEALAKEDRALRAEINAATAASRLDIADGSAWTPLLQQGRRVKWVQERLARAQQRRAELAQEIEAARSQAALSFGKHRALEHLHDQARNADRRNRIAQIERETPIRH